MRLHELSQTRASLEQAFMELTADSVEYHAGNPRPGRRPPAHRTPRPRPQARQTRLRQTRLPPTPSRHAREG